jgi:hypothetical protein
LLLPFIFAFFLLALVFLQNRSGSRSAELSRYPDESAHYVTGLMVPYYLLHGWGTGPVSFAADYYLYYPKVAIGHWPPVFYLVQFLWMTVFPTTISSLLDLQATLLATAGALLFKVVRTRFGFVAAGVLAVAFLVLKPSQVLVSEIMSEPLLALLTLLATWTMPVTLRPAP